MVKATLKSAKNRFDKLCSPSKLYLAISLVSVLVILFQNLYDTGKYCLGTFSCSLHFPNIFMFVFKLVYIVVFTIILDGLCKTNYTNLAWGLVLLPYLLMFVLLGIIMLSVGKQ